MLMKHYKIGLFSYGVELEYGNCERRLKNLPNNAQWNNMDKTCVSSTGIANDPKGELYNFGGEINVAPTNTVDEQCDFIENINKYLSDNGEKPIVNYRSNLHIHIRVPELETDLDALKQLLKYIHTYQQQFFDMAETIPVPNKQLLSAEEYKWAKRRYNRRLVSHQHKLSNERVDAMLNATTPLQFWYEHAHKDKKGNPAWFQCPRAGINLRQIFERTNTIEFRCFPGTLDRGEMRSAIRLCRDFLDMAFNHNESSPYELLKRNSGSPEYRVNRYNTPKFEPYEYETEQVYQYTNFEKNNRKQVKEKLDMLRKHINIDDMSTSSKSVYKIIKEMK